MCTCHFIHLHLHGNRLTVNQGYTNPTVGYFFNISKCKYWYIKLLVGYQYPRSGSWLIGIRYLNIVTFRQYLKFRNSVSNRSFWPCLDIIQHTQTEAFPMPKDASNYLSYFTHVVFKPIGVKLQYPAQLIHETSQY